MPNLNKIQRKLNRSIRNRDKAVRKSKYSNRYAPQRINTIVVISNATEIRERQ